MKLDLEILELLPDESDVKVELQGHVESAIRRIITVEDISRRDPIAIATGVVGILGSGGLFYGGANSGGWWWYVAAAYVLVGSIGILVLGNRKRLRDISGRAFIEAPP
ncbi:hypothetical protein ACFCYH_36285 [Streptomyces sp. NPDC056400]|uniref:hypothetical protein n=1 Tax=Streptomyces sp. NPDC056400 TaxID=3345808 RepID=UPI0035DB56A1